MQIAEYLEKYQPVIFKTFVNAKHDEKLSHAYLLSGSVGMPLKETAIYLAKSLLCDEPNPLACEHCITCLRVDEGNYSDLKIFDGSEGRIKKEDVQNITGSFDSSALEEKGIMIYIIHLVENMTPVAVNALLKFLEEPGRNIFAFLTTENESKVLPTIISRTQVLRFREIDREEIIKNAEIAGVLSEDAEILSGFLNGAEAVKNVSESEEYKVAKQALDDQLNALLLSPDDAVFTCHRLIIPQIKTYDMARLYLKMLAEVFKDLLNISVGEKAVLSNSENINRELLGHLNNIDRSLLIILSSLSRLDLNINIPLLLDHVVYEITKEAS